MTAKGITLDGILYDVYIVYGTIQRTFNLISGQAEGTNILGGDIPDILGTKYGYQLNVEPNPENPTAYDDFYQQITSPVASHTIQMPYGQTTLSFSCRVISGTDYTKGKQSGFERWSGLAIQILPINPQRRS